MDNQAWFICKELVRAHARGLTGKQVGDQVADWVWWQIEDQLWNQINTQVRVIYE